MFDEVWKAEAFENELLAGLSLHQGLDYQVSSTLLARSFAINEN